jgi:PAS domain-containing protein
VEGWFRQPRNQLILQPKWRGRCRYVSRAAWRRLARERPQVLGGYPVDRLHALLEDRELAERVLAQCPRQLGDWRIRCVEDGRQWRTAGDAARELHVSQAAITLAMREGRPVVALGMRFEAA